MTSRFNTSRQTAPSIKCRFLEAIELSARLRKRIQANLATGRDFQSLEQAVEAIPITTHEYTWLRARVRNAKVYVGQRELCAAAYELALVANRLLARRRLWHEAELDKHP
jgi:hypothetical protein